MAEPWNEETIPGMFLNRVARFGDRAMLVSKRDGRWTPASWNAVADRVRALGVGLIGLGLGPKGTVALLARNREEWTIADLAIMGAGGVTVPIYASNVPKDVAYVIGHSESRIAIVEDLPQLAKVTATWAEPPLLERVILIDGEKPADPRVLTFAEVEAMGRAGNPRDFDERVRAIGPEDLYTISYTSGTTGPPKGAMMPHRSMRFVNRATTSLIRFRTDDATLSFLPLAHMMERFIHYSSIDAGVTIHFAESLEKVPENLLEVRPHAFFSVPRLFEKVYAAVQTKAEQGSWARRRIFRWARKVGHDFAALDIEKKTVPLPLRISHRIADRLVFGKIRERLGGRARFLGSGGAPLAREIAEFFYGAGLPVIEAYGLTETSAPATLSTPEAMRFGTVGKPLPGVDVRIAEDGEVLIRGGNLFTGYFKRPEDTAEAMDGDWFRSGDVGRIDEDGFLAITDRKKDLIITAGGKNIAPQNIEGLLKNDRRISQAVLIGDRRPYCVALVTLNMAEVRPWADREGLAGVEGEDLACHPTIRALVQSIVDEKNRELPRFEQIKKFAVLPADFSQETGELTPTLKVKRKVVSQKYADRIEALYAAGVADA